MVTPAVHIKYLICNVHFVTETAAGVKLIIPLSQKKHNITIILEKGEIYFSTNEKVKMITKNVSAPWKNPLTLLHIVLHTRCWLRGKTDGILWLIFTVGKKPQVIICLLTERTVEEFPEIAEWNVRQYVLILNWFSCLMAGRGRNGRKTTESVRKRSCLTSAGVARGRTLLVPLHACWLDVLLRGRR